LTFIFFSKHKTHTYLTKKIVTNSCFNISLPLENFKTPGSPWEGRSHSLASVLPNTEHLPVAPMSSDVNNNLIESFNKTFKAWYKAKKGFNSFDKTNNLIYLFIFHYNFIRPHGSLNNCTPAEVAGFASDSFAKNSWFSAA